METVLIIISTTREKCFMSLKSDLDWTPKFTVVTENSYFILILYVKSAIIQMLSHRLRYEGLDCDSDIIFVM